jgi:hypothetical protein
MRNKRSVDHAAVKTSPLEHTQAIGLAAEVPNSIERRHG